MRRDGTTFEVTPFRIEHEYADFRRPHRVEFGDDLVTDLARRDFTVNAIAWGRPAAEAGPPSIEDPFDGTGDLERRILRAVGDPEARFREDALRMVRAVRLAAVLDFTLEPATQAAIAANAALAAHLSHERVGAELDRLLMAPRPSVGLRLAAETGLLAVIAPELAAQQGIPQSKVDGEDLWDHTLRTVDAAPASRPVVRLAALVHDLGKPATLADGHFHHHDVVGARLTESMLRPAALPAPGGRRRGPPRPSPHVRGGPLAVGRGGAAVPQARRAAIHRRAVRAAARGRHRVRARAGRPALLAFRARLDAELAAEAALDRAALAIDGDDLDPGARRRARPAHGAPAGRAPRTGPRRPAAQRPRDAAAPGPGPPPRGRGGGRRVIEILLQAERTLAAGRIDEAERLYRQAAGADPRSSIAVVGLARVALERGDDLEAWRLGRRALGIDPENVAAQRLTQRLDEVYAYRGESIAALAAEGDPASAMMDDAPAAPDRRRPRPLSPRRHRPAAESRSLADRLFRRKPR